VGFGEFHQFRRHLTDAAFLGVLSCFFEYLLFRLTLDDVPTPTRWVYLGAAVIDVPPEGLGGDLLNTNDAFNLYVKSDISKIPLPNALLLLGSGLPGSIPSAMT
jgi:hypothetical protein